MLSRNSLIVGAALLLLTALAWSWLWFAPAGADGVSRADMGAMDGMDMAGMPMPLPMPAWSITYLSMAFLMWSVMMVAMMLPSAAPMILLHARIDRPESEIARLGNSALFILAYLLAWSGFAALAAVCQALLLELGWLSRAQLALGHGVTAAALLMLAAIYEMTPAKRRCLDQCQAPLIFVHRYWRPGPAGTFRLGLRHGLFCLGCCWALMLLLFVGGVMNLAWVALLTILVTAQKAAPPRWRAHRWTAAALLLTALFLLLRSA
ncbi:DUF2182 domain-containing protein [Sphingobium mellinum]|uniref:DUF2182 domain-containing protein n=1 Tax=Sphingobium mellinum TaxID=1387166 RepID=UPI0030EDF983